MGDEPGKGDDSKGDESNDTKVTVEVNGEKKEFGATEVTNLLAQQAAATQSSQVVAPILKKLEAYGVTADEFLTQAEGSFKVTRDLIDAGVINEKGELVKTEPVQKKEDTNLDLLKGGSSDEKTAAIVTKALGEALGPITKRLDGIDKEQLGLLRENISKEIVGKYTSFSSEDVSKVLARASADTRKSMWDHAEEVSKEKRQTQEDFEVVFAKKHGLDLDVIRNKLKEQDDGGGGGAATIFKNKKFSFNRGPKRDKDSVDPATAMQEFMNKSLQGG